MKKYEELVNFIIQNIGGKDNVLDVTHCVTRLRFKLKDADKANDDVIKANDGVITIMRTSGQYQVVIGNHVPDVYKELADKLDLKQTEVKEKKMSFKDKALDLISGIFLPSLSLLCACGMIKGFNIIFPMLGLYAAKSDLATLISSIGDSFFYFFPVVVGFNTAKKLKMNPYLGLIIGAALVYPAIQAVDMTLFGLHINVTYTSTVLPVIFICFLAAPMERFFNRVLPDMIKSFMTPTIVLLVSVVVGYIFIGPFANSIGTFLSNILIAISEFSAVLGCMLFAGLWPVLVLLGIHTVFFPICFINLANGVPDPLFASLIFSCFATTGICLAVSVKTKDGSLKGLSFSSFISGIFGVTEPALYGIFASRPLLFGISCVVSGIAGGISGFLGFAYRRIAGMGVFELPAIIPEVGAGPVMVKAAILAGATIIMGFVVTFILYKDDKDDENVEEVVGDVVKKKNDIIDAPLEGAVLPLSEAKDEVFASGVLGKGCVIVPSDNKVYAPFDGTVLVMFPTGHAVGLINENGCEILIHIGINTVELEGKPFTVHVKEGDKVKKGQLLIEFDREAIKEAGYSEDTMIIVSNSKDFKNIECEALEKVEVDQGLLLVEA